MMAKEKIYETDLYEPIQNYFYSLGYQVQAEVNGCDVVAFKEESLIIIELKLNLNITLLVQAANRQKYTKEVYIAIPRPKTSLRKRKWKDLVHLIRRMELGLILVSFEGRRPSLDIVHEPSPFDRKKSMQQNRKGKNKILEEARKRKSNQNIGGSHKITMMTAYKEMSIQIAFYIDYLGPMSARELQKLQTGEKTYGILYNNFYKWFKRIDRGVYDLTDLGRREYKKYPDIIQLYRQSELK